MDKVVSHVYLEKFGTLNPNENAPDRAKNTNIKKINLVFTSTKGKII
jgi:hypothetical protein